MRSLVKLGIKAVAASLLPVIVISASVAQGAAVSPERQAQRAVELRQSLFRMISYGYTPLGDMLKNRIPFDAEAARRSSALLVVLAPIIGNVFKSDTRQFEVKTWAREEIWTRQADFQAKTDSFVKAAGSLAEAVKGGDQKVILQAAAAVGRTCSACHDQFTQ